MYLDVTSMLTNAQQMAQTHPDTFYAPDSAELQSIRPGCVVKVCASPEQPDGQLQMLRNKKLVRSGRRN